MHELFLHDRSYDGGIQAPTEKHADRYIAHEMRGNSIGKPSTKGFDPFFFSHIFGLAVIGRPIALDPRRKPRGQLGG